MDSWKASSATIYADQHMLQLIHLQRHLRVIWMAEHLKTWNGRAKNTPLDPHLQ